MDDLIKLALKGLRVFLKESLKHENARGSKRGLNIRTQE